MVSDDGEWSVLRLGLKGDPNQVQLVREETSEALGAVPGVREVSIHMGYATILGTPNPEDLLVAVSAPKNK